MSRLAVIDLAAEYDEYLDEVVWLRTDRFGNKLQPWVTGDQRFWVSRLDYAYDVDADHGIPTCPLDCGMCRPDVAEWLSWLRAQDVYPPPPLSRPVIAS